MSSSHPYPGPVAYSAYPSGISPPGSPALLSDQSIGHHDYSLSTDQLSNIVAGIRQLPTPSQNSSRRERYSDLTEEQLQEQRRRRHPQIGPDPALDLALREKFPSVKGSVVTAIANHKFEADELHKLDSNLGRRGYDGQGTGPEGYPVLQSLIDPLTTYFRILLASRTNVYDLQLLADGSHQYLSHLVAFAATYEWVAVLAYHFDFFRARVREMKDRNYSEWAHVDAGLHARHLTGRERSTYAADHTTSTGGRQRVDDLTSSDHGLFTSRKQLCELFNSGVCLSPCRYRRIHECRGCGSDGHLILTCPSSPVLVDSTDGIAHS